MVSKFRGDQNEIMETLALDEQKVSDVEDVLTSSQQPATNNQQPVATNQIPLPPSVDRPINVMTSLSGPEKDEIIEQINHFSASLRNKPENLHEWIQLGNLRKVIGDYSGAVEYWKYASLLMPNYHVPYNNLGNLYQYYLNDVVKAEEYYKKYIELSPQTEDPYKLLFDLYTTSYKEKENLAQGILEEGIKNATHNNYLKTLLNEYIKEKNAGSIQ